MAGEGPQRFRGPRTPQTLLHRDEEEREIAKAAVAMPALACEGFLDGPNDTFYDDFTLTLPGWPSPQLAAAGSAVANTGLIITGTTQFQLLHAAKASHSVLTQSVPQRAVAIRITQLLDLTNDKTLRVLQDIVRLACKLHMKVFTWASVPCTASCPWRHLNAAKGIKTCDVALTSELIKNAPKLCRLTRTLGGDFVWEWPKRCDLWNDWRVVALTKNLSAFITIASSAIERHDFVGDTKVYIKKRWNIVSIYGP